MLVQATQVHELLAQYFREAHLRMEGKNLFSCNYNTYDLAENLKFAYKPIHPPLYIFYLKKKS
jgi:hypothetical protein